jgi:putative sigma-54 modulation protein
MNELNINLKGTNIELTDAVKDYVLKRVTNLGKLLSKMRASGGEIMVNFEIGKNTNHHKSGAVFHADCLVNINGKELYYSTDKEDLYEAIDSVKDSLFSDISKNKDKRRTLFHEGARRVKNMLKGIKNFRS